MWDGGMRGAKEPLTAKQLRLWSLAGLSGQHKHVPPCPDGVCPPAATPEAHTQDFLLFGHHPL